MRSVEKRNLPNSIHAPSPSNYGSGGVAIYEGEDEFATASFSLAEEARLFLASSVSSGLIGDSAGSPVPSVRFNSSTMSQDAEDGPELVVGGYTTRPPMNQEEFDRRFAYSRPQHQHGAMTRRAGKCLRRYYQPCISWRNFANTICGFVPILRWLPAYSWKSDFLNDVVGGFTVGIMHVPQGIAYAILANVPPIVGLYTSFFPPLFYMIFGTSRHNSIGSFAVVSLMAGMTVDEMISSGYGLANTEELDGVVPNSLVETPAVVIASTLALCVGLLQLLMGFLRLEILTTYFSDQLVAGFTTAASFHVFVAQLRDFFGIRVPRRFGPGNLFQKLYDVGANIHHVNPITLAISTSTLVFLIVAKDFLTPYLKRKRVNVPIPYELIVVVLWTIVSTTFHLNADFGVRIVHSIPIGLPIIIVPDFELLPQLIPRALSIAFVVIAVHISLAKMFAKKLSYKVDSSQELYALGLTASLSSFFPVYPVSCSLGRTIVNVEAGTKTQLSTLFSSILLGSVILYLGHYLRALPMCVLAATIIVALKGMTRKFKELGTLWPLSKIDFCIWLVSFVATVAWDVTEGLAVSICFALLTTVFRTQWPRWHYLANLKGTNDFRDAERYHCVRDHSGICIFRFDSPLLFTNVDCFKNNIHKAFERWQKKCPRFLTEQDLYAIPTTKVSAGSRAFASHRTVPVDGAPLSRIDSTQEVASSTAPSADIGKGSRTVDEANKQYTRDQHPTFQITGASDSSEESDGAESSNASQGRRPGDVESACDNNAVIPDNKDDEDTTTRITMLTPTDKTIKSVAETHDDTDTLSTVDHLNTMISTRSKFASYIPHNKPMAGLLYRHFIIDCSGFTFVDYMGVNALKEIFQEMRNEKVLVYFAAAKAPVRDLFEMSGFYKYVPKTNFYPTIRDAMAIARKRRNASTLNLLEELSLPYDRLDDAISSQPLN